MINVIKKTALAIVCEALLLTGCSENIEEQEEQPFMIMDDIQISVGGAKLLFYATEKKKILDAPDVKADFWNKIIDEKDGTTYGQYEKEVLFYEQLLNLLALSSLYDNEYEYKPSDQGQVSGISNTFFSILDDNDRDLLEISVDDVENIFELFFKAKYMETKFIDKIDIIISEEEYRVCLVDKYHFTTETNTNEFIKGLSEEKSIDSLIKLTDETTSMNVNKSSELTEREIKDIFSLKTNEHSQVYHDKNGYYLYYMKNVYDNDLSLSRKEQLISEKQKNLWQSECKKYIENAKILFNSEEWKNLEFSLNDKYSNKLALLFDYV